MDNVKDFFSSFLISVSILGVIGLVAYLAMKKYFRRLQRKEEDARLRQGYEAQNFHRDLEYQFNFRGEVSTSRDHASSKHHSPINGFNGTWNNQVNQYTL